MPHRLIEQYVCSMIVGAGVLVSFAGAIGKSLQDHTANALYAVAEPAASVDPMLMTWIGAFAAIAGALMNVFFTWRQRSRDADIADATSWEAKLRASASEWEKKLSDSNLAHIETRAQLKSTQIELGRAQGDVAATKRQLAEALEQIAYLNAQVRDNRHDIRDVKQSASIAAELAVKAADQAAEHGAKIADLENHVGSGSGLNLPTVADPKPGA